MGFNLTQYRLELRTDLKDSGAVWSNAELDRCVKRAVEDFSRFMPLERNHEVTHNFTITDESITTGEDTDTDQVVDNVDISAWAADSTATITANPDKPRVLTFLITDANTSITDFTITVEGTDQDDYATEETFVFGGGLSQTGKKIFKTVTRVLCVSIAGNGTSDVLDIGVGSIHNVWHYLASKPIRPESEEVTSSPAGTTYTRDTDYRMDYINGAIKTISGGSMAAATTYLVDYTKSRLGVSLIDEVPEYKRVFRITRVQYPADIRPQQFAAFNIWNDFMYVGSQKAGESQEEMTNKKHLVIYYEMMHRYPTIAAGGTIPDTMDEVIAIGAGGYALLIEAMQYEQQAVTDLASLRTELGLTTAIHVLANAALDKVTTYLETNGTTDNAKDVLANVTDDIAKLRTAINTAVDAANTYLDEVDTTDLGQATVGAEGLLETGDGLINAVNVGEQVAALYASYSRARVDIGQARISAALGFAQEAQIRLSNLRSYIEEAGGWNRIAEDFIAEGQTRIAELQTHLAEAAQYQETAGADMVLADRFRAEGAARLTEFRAILEDKSQYRKRTSTTPVKQPA